MDNEIKKESTLETAPETSDNSAISNNLNVATIVDTVVARSEATQILVNIINAFLNVRQKSENKLTEEEIAAIQNAINEEASKTDALFATISSSLNLPSDKTADSVAEPPVEPVEGN